MKRVFETMCKPFHAGNAYQAGLMAELLAQDNFTSAEDILEGPISSRQEIFWKRRINCNLKLLPAEGCIRSRVSAKQRIQP